MTNLSGVTANEIVDTLRTHMGGYEFQANGFVVNPDGVGNFLVRVEIAEDPNGFPHKTIEYFNSRCAKFGLERTDLGREVRISRKRGVFRIMGIKPRCSKHAILVEHTESKRKWRVSRDLIKFVR